MLFYVLFVCKRVLYYYHRVSTQLQVTNISFIIYFHLHDLIFFVVNGVKTLGVPEKSKNFLTNISTSSLSRTTLVHGVRPFPSQVNNTDHSPSGLCCKRTSPNFDFFKIIAIIHSDTKKTGTFEKPSKNWTLSHSAEHATHTGWHKRTGAFEIRSGGERMHTWMRTPSTGRNFQTLIIWITVS